MDIPYIDTSPFRDRSRDKNWVRRSYGINESTMDKAIEKWRVFTTADMKFTDTSIGGNFAINSPPQYTPYADIRRAGISSFAKDPKNTNQLDTVSLGMGRFYSEQIDDHAQLVHMQFGTMKFRGMLTFFTGFYSNSASLLAREGRAPLTYYIGRIAGAILTLPLWPFVLAGQAARYLMDRPGTKYAYFVPSMGPYWNKVNFITNAIGVNTKLVAHVFDNNDLPSTDEDSKDAAHYREYMSKIAGTIFRKDGSIDMYVVANRAQRMANKHRKALQAIGETANSSTDLQKKINEYYTSNKISDNPQLDIKGYLDSYHKSVLGSIEWAEDNDLDNALMEKAGTMTGGSGGSTGTTEGGEQQSGDAGGAGVDDEYLKQKGEADKTKPSFASKIITKADGAIEWVQGWGSRVAEHLEADLDHGSGFVTFKVDHTGTQADSFSNQVKDPAIRETINGMSASAKSVRHSFSDGMTGLSVVDAITSSVKGLISGAMDSVHISGLLALAGNAFVDIPQVWENSTANLASTSYNVQLRTPYGDPIARMQNLYAPLAMLLAGALPHSAGSQAYTTPHYCMLFSKGMRTIRLGMITDISISRGVGNLGWTKDWEPLGFDVSFTVKDLSSVMHTPITSGFDFFNPFKRIFADDTTFSDFLAALSSMDYKDQYYKQRQFWFNLTRAWTDYEAFFSTAQTTNMIGNSALGRITSAVIGDAYRMNAR